MEPQGISNAQMPFFTELEVTLSICFLILFNNHSSFQLVFTGIWFSGVPWTEEEHRLFLFGLQRLGKGDWRGISRNYVISRTPTQVASHAQKYFIRQSNATRRKRRSSLFDMVPDMVCLASLQVCLFHALMHISAHTYIVSPWCSPF